MRARNDSFLMIVSINAANIGRVRENGGEGSFYKQTSTLVSLG